MKGLPKPPSRVGVVEDDPILGEHFASIVRAIADASLAGVAETLADARALVAQDALDILLLDLGLPDGSGLDLIAAATATGRCKVIVISLFGDVRNVVRAIELGADGYLLKDAEGAEVAQAIASLRAGGAPISPAVAGHLFTHLRLGLRAPLSRPAPAHGRLTPRELVVLEYLAKGLSYKDAAGLVGVSYNTVADHVKAIYRKLAVSSRGEAVFEAVQAGLISLD